jgi:hypothetical protein
MSRSRYPQPTPEDDKILYSMVGFSIGFFGTLILMFIWPYLD